MKRFSAALFVFIALFSACSAARIDPRLMSKIRISSASEKLTAIVYMKDQADINGIPRSKLEEKIAYLEGFSREKQKGISAYLEKERKNKKVQAFKRFWSFNGFAVSADRDVIMAISEMPDVDRIVLNAEMKLPPLPDTDIGLLAVKPAATTVEANISQIKADQVWTYYSFKGSGIKVGIADTGILDTHTGLSGRISLEATFDSLGSKESDTAPYVPVFTLKFDGGHGTHVAGIVAGNSGVGVAPESALLIAKVFDNSAHSTFAQVVGGVDWLISKGAKVINLSLGDESGLAVDDWKTQVNIWQSLGVVIVAAIGNEGPLAGTTNSPGNVPAAIGVGAVDETDTVTSWSSRGPVVWSGTTYTKPDIAAPGLQINSTYIDGSYKKMSGTSMATPHVAGIIALMLEANSTISVARIKQILEESSVHLPDAFSVPNNNYGYGRVDALAAVTRAKSPDVTPPVITHTPVTSAKFGEPILLTAIVTDDSTLPLTVRAYYKNLFNEWKTVTMDAASTGSSSFSGTIPAADIVSDVNYYMQAQDYSGNTSVVPAGAPAAYYTATLASQTTLTLSNNQTCPNPYPAGSGSMTISYYLSKPADITVRFFSMAGELVKTFTFSGGLGLNTFNWNGILDNGELASNGVYLYQISARDTSGADSSIKGKIIILK